MFQVDVQAKQTAGRWTISPLVNYTRALRDHEDLLHAVAAERGQSLHYGTIAETVRQALSMCGRGL